MNPFGLKEVTEVAKVEKLGTNKIKAFENAKKEASAPRDFLTTELKLKREMCPVTEVESLRAEDIEKVDIDPDNEKIRKNEFYSTYEERINQTPKEGTDRGYWDGKRGESVFYPPEGSDVSKILSRYGMDGIPYKDGIPDFSGCSEASVKIDNMSENRANNFRECDQKCAEQWNKEGRDGRTDWTADDIKEWRRENGYSWHERNDMQTCDLIPTEVNDYFGHLGGVSECKKRDTDDNGGDFDD